MPKQNRLFPPRRRSSDHSPIIEFQLLSLAYQQLPAMLIVNVTAAIGAGLVLRSDGFTNIYYWVVAVIILSLLRLLSWVAFKRTMGAYHPTSGHTGFWHWIFALGIYAAGCLWVGLVMATFEEAPYASRFTLMIIISALAGGATGISAALKYVGRIYITILLLITSIVLYLTSPEDIIIAMLGMVFWVAMVISHRNNHYVLKQSLTLQLENKQLITNLQELNTDLEQRVNQRTQALKRIAHHDSLTGLPNRRGLMEWMENNLDPEIKDESAILFLDLDRFKQINDALGHDVGDQVLQTIAYRFNQLCPDTAILGRWGGDEFLLITAQSPTTRQQAEILARQLIETATAPLQTHNEILGLGLSVGIAYYPTDAKSLKEVIHAADLTVAEVKRSGRGQTLTYNDTYAETQRRRFDLGRALSNAIENSKLHLVYQPIVDVKTGHVSAMEVLVRWRHPVLGDINPNEFVHLAEDTDRIIALGDWVLTHACQAAKNWRSDTKPIKIAVNVSIKQLLVPQFSHKVAQILQQTNFPAENLILEVTESLFGEEYLDSTLDTVKQLQKMNIEVHIDDFGTGYSSLSRLHEFPVTAIKIDRSFVAQIEKQGLVIIESAVMIAKRMNLKVIAEGVETLSQAEQLYQMGIDSLQGFYCGKPEIKPMIDKIETLWIKST
jgi:diguanylate cyclase (GGDEF)-like protein